jgi:D-alanyl-D-alanine carboxypeptidase (penicillin-binding protein 5/6)
MYRTYNARPIAKPYRSKRRWRSVVFLAMLPLILLAYLGYATFRPLPSPKTIITPPVTPALVKVGIPWPKSSEGEQSAYGADGFGLLSSSNTIETAVPTASIAKVVTALAVLDKKPLKPGTPGPSITLTAADSALYKKYAAEEGSVLPVSAGDTITEYQALQAMMLPSANNIADTLAIWAFGSLPEYTDYARGFVKKIGMNATNITDASGFSKTTVSTAPDLIKLGDAALDNPVLAEVVNQPTATIPGFGTIKNTNLLLGQAGIRGIKTGNTDEAGGCFLAAADVKVGSGTVRVITAVMGASNLATAMRDTLPLIRSTPSQFQTVSAVRGGQAIGTLTTPWGASSPIVAKQSIDAISWTGATLPPVDSKTDITLPAKSGADIGDLTLNYQGKSTKSDIILAGDVAGPSLWWRLTHPF